MNKLAKIESTELDKEIQKAGLAIQEGEDIKKSYQPFLNQLAEIQTLAEGINFDTPELRDEQLARELRLKTVKIRTSSADLKDSRKKVYLLKGNLEQAAFNLIAASCKLAEESLLNVEKAREIAEAKRIQEDYTTRQIILSDFTEIMPMGLGEMSQDVFDNYLTGVKIAYQAKKDAEAKAEAERLAKIEAERIENERIRQENERLQKEAEERERLAKIERKKQAKVLAEIEAKADIKAKEEKEAHEKEMQKLEEENRKQMEAAAEDAKKYKAIQNELTKLINFSLSGADEKLAKEKAERERLANELKKKQEQEAKARAEQAAIDKARKEQEKKAAKAPDKEKLINLVNSFTSGIEINLKTPEAREIENLIWSKFESFKAWAKQQIETL